MPQFKGVDALLKEEVGDLNKIVSCIDTVKKEEKDGATVYTLTLNPDKYMESDEILTMLKDAGSPVLAATFAFGFDRDGHIVSILDSVEYEASSAESNYTLTNFDSTVVDPMPEADKTLAEMNADIDKKYEDLEAELDSSDSASSASASSSAA